MITLRAVGLMIALASAAIVYAAFGYTPETIAYGSPFLAENRSAFVDTTHFRAHFVERGAGHPVVMIHGGGTWLYSFRHNLDPLSRRFHAIALDMPGHGYTEPTHYGIRYDFDTTDRFLLEFLDAKNLEQVSLVGHSWGGDWALHFAQQHPERVRKLVLIGSSGLAGDGRLEWDLLSYPILGDAMANLFRSRVVGWGLRAAFANPALVTSEMILEVYAPASFPENRRAQVAYSRSLDYDKTQARLAQTRVPTLILWGSQDQYGPASEGQSVDRALPRSRFEAIEGAGHNAHEEKPELVNQLITAFLLAD